MKNKKFILDRIESQQPELVKYGIREIGLFVSYAINVQTENSDTDILIDFELDKGTHNSYLGHERKSYP